MKVDTKKIFQFAIIVSVLFIGIAAFTADFSKKNFYRSGYRTLNRNVLGENTANTSGFYIRLDQIPPATENDSILISGGKVENSKVLLWRDNSSTAIIVTDDLNSENWSYNAELHNGTNHFRYKMILADTNGTGGTNTLGVEASINSDGTEISFSVEKLSDALTADFTYTKNPAPEGWVRIKAVFSKPLRTIPKLKLNQKGSIDIAEGVYMSGSGRYWYYDYFVHKESGDYYRNGIAKVSIVNAIDIYDRPLENTSHDTFEIRAEKEVSSNNNSNSTQPETSSQNPQSAQALTDLSNKLNEDFTTKSSDNESSSSQTNAKYKPSRIISVEPLNGLARFNKSTDIYLSVVYYRDPGNERFNTKEYTVKGYDYNAMKNPIFIDFSRIDSDFKTATVIYGKENILHGDLRQRLITYTGSKTSVTGEELVIPAIINDEANVDLYDNLKIEVKDVNVKITNLETKKQKEFLLNSAQKNGVEIQGQAAPNSNIQLFIFSSPVITTVRTNDDGTWTYTVRDDIEVGVHNIYISEDSTFDITKLIKIGDFKVYASEDKDDSDLYNNISTQTVEYFPSEFNTGIQKDENLINNIFGKTLSTPVVIVVLGLLSIAIAALIGYLFYRQSNELKGKVLFKPKRTSNNGS